MLPIGVDDEVNDRIRPKVRRVGKARETPEEFQNCPQAYLIGSHHPYAPFVGDTIDWNSWVYDDATTFEGLTRDNVPHGKGVMTFGVSGKGGGIKLPKAGDRYEGEFSGGVAHGVGIYTGANGSVYKGEFTMGLRDGCGMEYDLQPLKSLVAKGVPVREAFEQTRDDIAGNVLQGTWNNGIFIAEPSDIGNVCSVDDVRQIVWETDSVATRARMFSFKPGGDATFFKSHLNGVPIEPDNHPLHYPHGTLFMAPGPAGQTAAVPQDKDLLDRMEKEWFNYAVMHNRYNFDYIPKPGSVMRDAIDWWMEQEKLRQRQQRNLDRIANRHLRRIHAANKEEKKNSGSDDEGGTGAPPTIGGDSDGPGGAAEAIDESDLLADAASAIRSHNGRGWRQAAPTSAFGSVGISHSAKPAAVSSPPQNPIQGFISGCVAQFQRLRLPGSAPSQD